jgi:hypothetical protein
LQNLALRHCHPWCAGALAKATEDLRDKRKNLNTTSVILEPQVRGSRDKSFILVIQSEASAERGIQENNQTKKNLKVLDVYLDPTVIPLAFHDLWMTEGGFGC